METLGELLVSLRKRDGLTLRQVEVITEKRVSNAYLSQIENGKILKPSLNILFALSEVYGVSYNEIMELAGYISARGSRESALEGHEVTNLLGEISKEEEERLLEYLTFLRSNYKK